MNDADVREFADLESLSVDAAASAVDVINDAVRLTGRCSLALSGGDTPGGLYRLLGSQHREHIPWARVHIFWGDDRYVPADHPGSNYRMARETLLDHVPCPAGNIHAMPTHISPAAKAATTYDEVLKDFFGGGLPRAKSRGLPRAKPRGLPRAKSGDNGPAFDLNILGIGEDAHTASIFPGSPAVDERDRWVMDVQTNATIATRLTLTLPALSHSANIYVLVAGAPKARALRQALAADSDPHVYPASGIRRGRGVVWWVDRDAAQG